MPVPVWTTRALATVLPAAALGAVAVVLARRSGKSLPAALLVGLTIGVSPAAGLAPVIFS
jgi:hypothetical protein